MPSLTMKESLLNVRMSARSREMSQPISKGFKNRGNSVMLFFEIPSYDFSRSL